MPTPNAYGTAMIAQARDIASAPPASQPATELDNSIYNLREKLARIGMTVSEIYQRVCQPNPKGSETGAVSPVALTYAAKLNELHNIAEHIQSLVAEMSGHI